MPGEWPNPPADEVLCGAVRQVSGGHILQQARRHQAPAGCRPGRGRDRRLVQFYNHQRPHQSLGCRTPAGLYPAWGVDQQKGKSYCWTWGRCPQTAEV